MKIAIYSLATLIGALLVLLVGGAVGVFGFVEPRAARALLVCLAVATAFVLVRRLVSRSRRPRHEPRDDDEALEAYVLLQREHRTLDRHMIAAAAERAWGIVVEASDGKTDDGRPDQRAASERQAFVVGEAPLFLISHACAFFGVQQSAKPYLDEASQEGIRELRLRSAIAEHHAWISVDLLRVHDGAAQVSSLMARLCAELADDRSVALLDLETQRGYAFGPRTRDKLRATDPRSALADFDEPPVLALDPGDPRVEGARKEAEERWPEFVDAFASREADEVFSVNAVIREGDDSERLWISVDSIQGDELHGRIGNEPVTLGLEFGSPVSIGVGEIQDWLFVRDGVAHGGFSLRLFGDQSFSGPAEGA